MRVSSAGANLRFYDLVAEGAKIQVMASKVCVIPFFRHQFPLHLCT